MASSTHSLIQEPLWQPLEWRTPRRHVVQFSGGITSWAAARRVLSTGPSNMTLLIADTLVEDEDLWRFADDASKQLGIALTRVADGRDPWTVFRHEHWLGNSHYAPCSKKLKQQPSRQWVEEHTDPEDTVIYVGLEWNEMHRVEGIRRGWAPWRVEFPLMNPPYRDKNDLLHYARQIQLRPPRLYQLGFAHNNCGGACVRGGQAAWAHLLEIFPERFAKAEMNEEQFRRDHGDFAILKEQRAGVVRPLPLRVLRERIQTATYAQDALFNAYDPDDWGGCGCANDFEP